MGCEFLEGSTTPRSSFYLQSQLAIFLLEFLRKTQNWRFVYLNFYVKHTKKRKKTHSSMKPCILDIVICINGKTYYTQENVHFYKIINTHWDTLFLLLKNNFFLSCEAIL